MLSLTANDKNYAYTKNSFFKYQIDLKLTDHAVLI